MEIKVLCPCGTKYQFPVEPVNGHMPQPVACPVCGTDNTEAANQVIQQKLAEAPAAAPQASATAGSGLRLATARAPEASVQYAPAPAPLPVRAQAPASGGTLATLKKVGGTIISIVLVVIGIYALYHKWNRRVGRLSSLVSVVSAIASGDKSGGAKVRWTLPDEQGGVLLVKHPNHTEVAQAFAAVHAELRKQPLKLAPMPKEEELSSEATTAQMVCAVFPAVKGTVEISAEDEWQEAETGPVAAALSKQLNTYVVMALMGHDAESGVVSIYQNGERKFRMKRWYELRSLTAEGMKEYLERDGDAWAKEHGYVPGPDKVLSGDTEAMPFEDVNQFVLQLGLDTSDKPDDPKGALVLKK